MKSYAPHLISNASSLWIRACLVLLSGGVAAEAAAANFTVLVGSGGLVYSPASLNIAVGDTVTFMNAGGLHNVVANDGSFRCANGCDATGGNGNVSSSSWHASITFDHAGTFPYFCEQHGTATSGMRGLINAGVTTPVHLQSFDVD